MMQEEKRFKIAEACGWIPHPTIKGAFTHLKHEGIFAAPDYFNDLNAIHKAEQILYSKGWDVADEYLKQLYKLVQDPHICQLSHAMDYVSSTAAQRAEAFGKTLNLW